MSANRLASNASLTAYASAPTAVATMRPAPAATNDPDIASSPRCFSTGSGSPVSSDSSSSSPSDESTSPSTTTCMPGASSRTSSRTTRSTGTSCTSPSRTTCAFGAVSTLSRSSVRFARSSCTMPIPAFAIRTNPNSASWTGPTTRITASIAPSSALNRVKTFERTICDTDRVLDRGTTLTRPLETRSATSVALRPRSASTMREAYPQGLLRLSGTRTAGGPRSRW